MKPYHKIKSVFKRDKNKSFIRTEYSMREFEYLKNNRWVGTEKVDGTNTRVMWNGEDLVFGGKTDNSQMPPLLLKKLGELFKADRFMSMFPSEENRVIQEVCLYGEGYGQKIQKKMGMKYNPNGVDFVLFDIKIGHWWLSRENIENVANGFGIYAVPIVFEGTLLDAIQRVENQGIRSSFGDFLAEGLVLKPEVELFCRNGGRVITKLKHCDFERK